MPDDALLKTALEVSVPLYIHDLRSKPRGELQALATEAAKVIAEHGDIIMFRGGKKGDTAAAFNTLARGLACLAFSPGGVKFLGLHFQAEVSHA